MENVIDDLKNKQKIEALKRLEILTTYYGIPNNILDEFRTKNTIYYNKIINNMFIKLDENTEFLKEIKEFEKEYNTFVYYCLLTEVNNIRLLDMLYVDDEIHLWKEERKDLYTGNIYVNTYNSNDYMSSEIGRIQMVNINNRIFRLY